MARRRGKLRLAGVKEVADQLGISKSSVAARRKRHRDFPKPLDVIAAGPVWDLSDIIDYDYRRRGDPNDPDYFLRHPDPYRRALERALRGLPPE